MRKVISMLLLICMGLVVSQGYEVVHANTMQYSVKANIPENQIDKKLTYFDLKISPGEKQVISLTVKNTSDRELRLMVEPNSAITNQNGVIDYSNSEKEKDVTLKYSFSEVISPKQEITLQGNESKEVPFTIQMPEESFDGIILGGFYIYEMIEENKETKKESVVINNEYSYVIGVKLTEKNLEVKPAMKLNDVKAGLMNYRTVVTANLQNIKPVIINNLTVEARVTKEGKDKTIHETDKSNMSMAPNSNFDFPINWENQKLQPGKYHLYMTATDGQETWNFDKTFEVTSEDAKKINNKAVEVEKDYTLLIIGLAVLILALVAVIVFLLMKRREKKSEEKE